MLNSPQWSPGSDHSSGTAEDKSFRGATYRQKIQKPAGGIREPGNRGKAVYQR